MSKKMKGLAFDSAPYGSYPDPKARLKLQTLMLDYQDLIKETEAKKKKLEAMKQRKLTLQAEVSFLRRRHKFLLKNKSSNPSQKYDLVRPQYVETSKKKSKKDRTTTRKESTQRNLPPNFNLNQNGRMQAEKRNTITSLTPVFNNTLHSVKEASLQNGTQTSGISQGVQMYNGKEVMLGKQMSFTDWNMRPVVGGLRISEPTDDVIQKESSIGSKEASSQSRIPVFDLNQVSCEEEETQGCEQFSFQERGKVSSTSVIDEQHNDLKLSLCRDIGEFGDDSATRPGKRKISWQDPVALRV